MRCSLAALVLAVTPATVEAAPVAWADLVGDYHGRLVWKGCNTPGAKQATVSLDAIDGALAIDLTAARGGLRAFSLAADAPTVWSGQQGDVSVQVSRPRANTLALDVTIDETCVVRATLARTTTPVADCDRLLAWSRIEQRCTKHAGPPLEDPKALAFERAVWRKQPKTTASCAARVDRLATAMIDAGCAPIADPEAVQLGASCRRLVEQGTRVTRCVSAPPELVRMAQHLTSLAVPGPDPASRVVAEQACDEGLALLGRLAHDARCPL